VNRLESPVQPAAGQQLVTLDDIRAAAERIRPIALRTLLLPLAEGAWLKPENLQPTGSFKIRGAYNALAQLSPEKRTRGVVTHSSGNHAQAIARSARLLGIRAVVVMPNNAPAIKVAGVRADGAEIVFVGPDNVERVERAQELADNEDLELVSSANDLRVIAGQGTVGLEIVEQLAELGALGPATVLAPVGLGGLSAGISTAVKALSPESRVLGVEPALAADTHESLALGRRVAWPAEMVGRTMADGLRGEAPSPIPFAHLLRTLDGVVTVEEAQISSAVRRAAFELKLVLEPSGAVTLAAFDALTAADLPRPVVIVASGGNVDPQRFIELLRD
jgi:threonine dehydratase